MAKKIPPARAIVCASKIEEIKQRLGDLLRDISALDKDTLELIYEERYQQGVSALRLMNEAKTMYFLRKERASTPGLHPPYYRSYQHSCSKCRRVVRYRRLE